MWLPKRITENSLIGEAFTAAVSFANGMIVRFKGASEGSGTAFLPYGIASVPPKGSKAAVIPIGRMLCVVGIEGERRPDLEEGEIALYSKGGASIVLKNDGRVFINGYEIAANG